MKKKFIAATMVALAAAGAYMGAGTLTRSTELSELQLANIEALAEPEIEVVSCVKEKDSVCLVIADGVVLREYKNKTKDRRN